MREISRTPVRTFLLEVLSSADQGVMKRGAPVQHDDTSSSSVVFGQGVLHLEIYQARGIKGDELNGLGKADPYLKIRHGCAKKKAVLESGVHQDAGSNPQWNAQFCFPMRNGGTRDHNVLDIEIWNENRLTSLFRGDNCLGHLRIGSLAGWITRHPLCITEPAWYPVFYKRQRSTVEEEKRGELLMKLYFQNVDQHVFAQGHLSEPMSGLMNSLPKINFPESVREAQYRLVGDSKQSIIITD